MSVTSSRGSTRGVVFIHSTPAALCPHLTWALEAVLGDRVVLDWTEQGAAYGLKRAELSWTGAPGTGVKITAALKPFSGIRYEVTEEPSPGLNGMRWCFTPALGQHSAWMAPNGDTLVGEQQLKEVLLYAQGSTEAVADMLEELLGTAWDAELEVFRHAGEGAPVRWLHKVG